MIEDGGETGKHRSLDCDPEQMQVVGLGRCFNVNFFWCVPFGYLFCFSFNVIASNTYIHPVYGGIRTHVLFDFGRSMSTSKDTSEFC